jgi:hypothetical protein
MTYGIINAQTRDWITHRAEQSGIELDRLGLDAGAPECGLPGHEEVFIPDNLYEISVMFEGALDEEFLVQTDCEVNIADWIAEGCRATSMLLGGERNWEVIVTEYAHDDAGPQRYRVSSDSESDQ